MAKVMVINAVWCAIVCGMIACSAMLYTSNTDFPSAYAYSQVASR